MSGTGRPCCITDTDHTLSVEMVWWLCEFCCTCRVSGGDGDGDGVVWATDWVEWTKSLRSVGLGCGSCDLVISIKKALYFAHCLIIPNKHSKDWNFVRAVFRQQMVNLILQQVTELCKIRLIYMILRNHFRILNFNVDNLLLIVVVNDIISTIWLTTWSTLSCFASQCFFVETNNEYKFKCEKSHNWSFQKVLPKCKKVIIGPSKKY